MATDLYGVFDRFGDCDFVCESRAQAHDHINDKPVHMLQESKYVVRRLLIAPGQPPNPWDKP